MDVRPLWSVGTPHSPVTQPPAPPPAPAAGATVGDGDPDATERLKARLSPRERQIMELLCCGFEAPEIGKRLRLTEKTVRNNLSNIYTKLNVRGRTEAVLLCLGASPRRVDASEPKATAS